MSAAAVTVPGVEDLAELASLATGFAAREHLMIVPAVPEHDCGPEVSLGPDELGLPGFLELAGKLGGGVLYLLAAPFDPDAVDAVDAVDAAAAAVTGSRTNRPRT